MTAAARETFWSRRVKAVEAEKEREATEKQSVEETRKLAEREQKTDAELLEELGLPDPDTLKPGDDFSAFMSKTIPARLRNRALRRLWRSNPVLANLDGLNDYDGDFSGTGLSGEVLQSSYQVGRGLVRHVEQLALAPKRKELADADTPKAPEEEVLIETDAPEEEQANSTQSEVAVAPKRRMRFAPTKGAANYGASNVG